MRIGVLAAGLAAAASCARGPAAEEAAGSRNPVKARVVPVAAREVRRNVEAVGSLFPLEEVTVSSEVEGRVDEIYVDVGDNVVRGRPLVKIVPVELRLAVEQEEAAPPTTWRCRTSGTCRPRRHSGRPPSPLPTRSSGTG